MASPEAAEEEPQHELERPPFHVVVHPRMALGYREAQDYFWEKFFQEKFRTALENEAEVERVLAPL